MSPQLVISKGLPLDVFLLVKWLYLVRKEHVDSLRGCQLIILVIVYVFIVVVVHARSHCIVTVEVHCESNNNLHELVSADFFQSLSWLLTRSLTLHTSL